MTDYARLVPLYIRSLGVYKAGKSIRQAQEESGVTCIKLAANENPFGPSPRALRAMEQVLGEVNFYPDPDAVPLRDALADGDTVFAIIKGVGPINAETEKLVVERSRKIRGEA